MSSTMSTKKIVLFFPSYRSREASPPLALIAIAGPLIGRGYEVVIVDASIEPDYIRRTVEAARDALCVGISLVTGPTALSDADGSALVIHAAPDDFRTDPTGNSGARIACGVITKSDGPRR